MSKLKYDHLLVCDIEATCWEGQVPNSDEYLSEIIEIGFCFLPLPCKNSFDASCKGSFYVNKESTLVKPQYSKVSEFCTQLTSLTQDQVDTGLSLAKACEDLMKEFCSKKYTWASWGDYDRNQFENELRRKGLHHMYPFGPRHLNLKNLFALMLGLKKEVGLKEAIEMLGWKFEGTHHRGCDDAYNIARIAHWLLAQKNP